MKIVTISREFGSGGRELGKRLADLLGFNYYDREIITAIAEAQGMDEGYVEKALEDHAWQHIPLTYGRSFSTGAMLQSTQTSLLIEQKRVLDGIRDGSLQYDFVEFMACPGGCINGGGQPIQHANVRNFTDIKALRAAALYKQDEGMTYRRSHENPVVQKVYADFLGEPGGHKAHALLHCSYIKQKRYRV